MWAESSLWDDFKEWIDYHTTEISLCLLLLAILGALYWFVQLAMDEEEQWQAFAKEHNCKIVEHKKGTTAVSTVVIPTSKGVSIGTGVTGTSSQTCYLCDDGVYYWR